MPYKPEKHWPPEVQSAVGKIWALADKLGADDLHALARVAKEMAEEEESIRGSLARIGDDAVLHYLDALFLRLKARSSEVRRKRRTERKPKET
jgi:hypothetical protein